MGIRVSHDLRAIIHIVVHHSASDPRTTTWKTIRRWHLARWKLGIGIRQLPRAIASGKLPVFDIGGSPRVRWSDVLAWIESTKRTVRDSPSGQRGAPEKRQ